VIWSVAAILAKYTIAANTLPKILCYESWGMGLGGISMYFISPPIRKSFIATMRFVRPIALIVMIGNEGVFVLSRALTFYAYSLGSAALVSVIGSTQVFYGILFGMILTFIAPKIFTEDTSRPRLLKKLFWSFVLFGGMTLVY
jgi:hypothetical protein